MIEAAAVKVKRCTKPWHAQPCYHGYCPDCGECLTAFDFDEDSCRRIAAGKPYHDCPQPSAQGRLWGNGHD